MFCYPQIRETRRTVRDSNSGLEQMSIGHHIRDRAHIMQRSRNHRTGDQEERQDYINLDESECSLPSPSFPAADCTAWPHSVAACPVLIFRWCGCIWWRMEARDFPLPDTEGAGLSTSWWKYWSKNWGGSSCYSGTWGFSKQTVASVRLVNPQQI